MSKSGKKGKHQAVPASRASRFARMARMAGGVAGGMLAEGSRQLRAGKKLNTRDMLMTPANARRVTQQLATMRGAAMKVGQMLSMDTGDFLPEELTAILARLRDDANYMPVEQLCDAMVSAFGDDWETLFYGFDMQPLAAASIGQVHRAYSPDGQEIVLKIQYPGVAKSIDSDVDNIATLLRVSGLLPEHLDIAPLLADAKRQLNDEADYRKEAKHLQAFGDLLEGDDRFVVPQLLPQYSSRSVLVMTYVAGVPIEEVALLSQSQRDDVAAALIELLFTELFELRLVQTDPNFANYRYQTQSKKIVLLDFGATRKVKVSIANTYRRLARAAMAEDWDRVLAAVQRLGYAVGEEGSAYRELVQHAVQVIAAPLATDNVYDFATSDIATELATLSEDVSQFRDFWETPPADVVFLQRKIAGVFLLASRLKARVNIRRLLEPWLS